MTTSKLLALTERLYRLLLLWYPADHRREYGQHMLQVFQDCCHHVYRTRGNSGVIAVCLPVFFDLLLTSVQERKKKGFHMSLSFLKRINGLSLMLGGVLLALASYSQLQPGSHYSYYGIYLAAMSLFGPSFVLIAAGLAGTYMHLKDELDDTGRIAALVAATTAVLFGTISTLLYSFIRLSLPGWSWVIMMMDLLVMIVSLAVFGISVLRIGLRWGILPVLMSGFLLIFLTLSMSRTSPVTGPLLPDFLVMLVWGVGWIVFGRIVQTYSRQTPLPAS